MGEVSLDLQNNITTNFVPKTISDFLKIVALIDNANEKVLKLKDFVKRLEDEMNKVDAFKRELPLCMLLLNDAIQGLKDEVVQCTALSNSSPRLEELVLLKKESDEGDGSGDKKDNECADKKSWIGSLKLCSNGSDGTNNSINDKLETKRNEGCNGSATGDLFKTGRDLSAGGVFVPFKALSGIPASASRKDENKLPVHELSLLAPGVENREQIGSIGAKTSPGRAERSYAQTLQSRVGSQQQQQPARKQRRCWSQELHKRFVNALQQLGGAQVATPKQIRELMHVDGLTNDEVKSHLQKYRLHIQRLSSAKASPANQSMGVLGGLSMSGDQYADSTKPSIPHSNSPQGPLQLAGNGGGTSTTGDSMDDDEDEKSDSHSWKSHFYKQGKDDV